VVKLSVPSGLRFAAIAWLCVVIAGCNRPPGSARDPESAATAFFSALEGGDARAAYDGAAFGFQAAQTFDAFLSNARELGLVGGHPPVWTSRQVTGAGTRLEGTVVTSSGSTMNLSVIMVPDGNAWKLFSLQTPNAAREVENRFTLVGKGTGFNDVYHQPMPSPRELDALVHQTIASFNTAIREGDFNAFYQGLSQQWKNGQRPLGDQASRITASVANDHSQDGSKIVYQPGLVTANMLKNHFQGFIDQKIDLSPLAILQPVYDRPPQIDAEGLLDLDGHFDTLEYRVNFAFEYAYELPWWKLYGLDVSLLSPK
jgi:hypothetical protein